MRAWIPTFLFLAVSIFSQSAFATVWRVPNRTPGTVQETIDAALASQEHGVAYVHLPAGEYNVFRGLHISGRLVITGAPGSILVGEHILTVSKGAEVNVSGVAFMSNGTCVLVGVGARASVSRCTFKCGTGIHVKRKPGNVTVEFMNNFWGSATGPQVFTAGGRAVRWASQNSTRIMLGKEVYMQYAPFLRGPSEPPVEHTAIHVVWPRAGNTVRPDQGIVMGISDVSGSLDSLLTLHQVYESTGCPKEGYSVKLPLRARTVYVNAPAPSNRACQDWTVHSAVSKNNEELSSLDFHASTNGTVVTDVFRWRWQASTIPPRNMSETVAHTSLHIRVSVREVSVISALVVKGRCIVCFEDGARMVTPPFTHSHVETRGDVTVVQWYTDLSKPWVSPQYLKVLLKKRLFMYSSTYNLAVVYVMEPKFVVGGEASMVCTSNDCNSVRHDEVEMAAEGGHSSINSTLLLSACVLLACVSIAVWIPPEHSADVNLSQERPMKQQRPSHNVHISSDVLARISHAVDSSHGPEMYHGGASQGRPPWAPSMREQPEPPPKKCKHPFGESPSVLPTQAPQKKCVKKAQPKAPGERSSDASLIRCQRETVTSYSEKENTKGREAAAGLNPPPKADSRLTVPDERDGAVAVQGEKTVVKKVVAYVKPKKRDYIDF